MKMYKTGKCERCKNVIKEYPLKYIHSQATEKYYFSRTNRDQSDSLLKLPLCLCPAFIKDSIQNKIYHKNVIFLYLCRFS